MYRTWRPPARLMPEKDKGKTTRVINKFCVETDIKLAPAEQTVVLVACDRKGTDFIEPNHELMVKNGVCATNVVHDVLPAVTFNLLVANFSETGFDLRKHTIIAQVFPFSQF